MTYTTPEILVSYYTADVLGTAVGFSSSCNHDRHHDGHCNGGFW